MLKVKLLGIPAIILDDRLVTLKTNKSQALLYYLVINAGFHSRDLLADLFWPNMQTLQARKNLRDALSHLRAELGHYLLVDRQKLAFNAAMPHYSDVHEFIDKIEQGRQKHDCALVEAGLAHYQAEFLAGLHLLDAATFEGWQSNQQKIYACYAIDAMTWLATTYLTMKKYGEGITMARRILTLEPWQENIHRLLMELFVYTGNQSAAIRQYEICRQQLASAMGIVPSLETEQLYSQIKQGIFPAVNANRADLPPDLPPDLSTPRSVDTPALQRPSPPALPHNLPPLHPALIGRDEAVSQLQALLLASTYPLVSLVGQGGVGKSSLALAVAHRLITPAQNADPSATLAAPLGLSAFPDGIWLVDLSTLSEQEQNPKQTVEAMAVAIAAALNITLTTETPFSRQLSLALRNKAALLILDNFEQLFAGVNYLVDLLQMAQSLQLLVTSQQRLALVAEYVFSVNELALLPLAVTQLATPPLLQQLLHYSAIQLFCEQAKSVQPAFRLTAENWAPVVRLCQLLDGLPLAIKLATALLDLYSCQQLADQLTQDYRLLTSNSPDLPRRQRSMHAVIEASWRRLAADEALVLAGCTQLQGSVDLTALQAITGATIAQVRKLIHCSLLHYDPTNQHFTLYKLIRQYGAEQLAKRPQLAEQVSQRHAEYFLNLLGQYEGSLLDHPVQIQRIKDYWENIIMAWQWSVSAGRLALIEKSAQALAHLHRHDNRLHEAIELFSPAITLARQQAELSGDAATQRTLTHLLSCTSEFYGQTATADSVAHGLTVRGNMLVQSGLNQPVVQ